MREPLAGREGSFFRHAFSAPVLLIHASSAGFVSPEHLRRAAKCAPAEKQSAYRSDSTPSTAGRLPRPRFLGNWRIRVGCTHARFL